MIEVLRALGGTVGPFYINSNQVGCYGIFRKGKIKISMTTSAGLDDAIVGGEAAKRLGIRFDLPTLPAKWIYRFVVSSSTISLQFNPSAVPQSLNTRHPLCLPKFKRFNNSLSITLVLMPI